MEQIPLNHEASAGETNKQVHSTLPPEVVQCLENARFLHLATCTENKPHVSLMNYTYLPSSPYSTTPVIVMTTSAASKKTNNLAENPNVSLLVHDWVSHRPPTASARRASGGSPAPESRSSLATLLQNFNTSELARISATMNGIAKLLPAGSEEEEYYRQQHLENNTFDPDSFGDMLQQTQTGGAGGDAGAGRFVQGEEVRVIVVSVKDVRISDWKGQVRDWVLAPEETRVNGSR